MLTNNESASRTKTTRKREMFDTKIPRIYDRPLDYTPEKYLTPEKELPVIGYDPQIYVDKFGNGAILAELQTIAISILRLMYTVPGNFPDYPEMGIDIRKYLFSFEDEFTASMLRQEILKQLPLLNVYISNPDMFYVIKTVFNNNPVIVIRLTSSYLPTNGLEDERIMNIGITFNEFHEITADISFAFEGTFTHFTIDQLYERT